MQSETLVKLIPALVKARGEIKHPPRNKTNPHFKNRYADLTAVLDAVVPAFTKNGLSLVQLVEDEFLITLLAHTSGEYITSATRIPPHNNAQQLGSALTYLRRYTVQAIAAIAADDDDDGTAASPKPKTNNKKASTPAPADDDSDW